jgi:hypothetical protein
VAPIIERIDLGLESESGLPNSVCWERLTQNQIHT